MNNAESISKDEIISLSSVFAGSALGFFAVYEATYLILEKLSSRTGLQDNSTFLIEFKRWNT